MGYFFLHIRQVAVFREKREKTGIYLHPAAQCGGKNSHQQEEKKGSVIGPASVLHLKSVSPEKICC